MAVAHDAVSEATNAEPSDWDTEDPKTWTHTPTGDPRGVLVLIAQNGGSSDQIAGVTYGGLSLSRVATNGIAQDTAGEAGACYAYFLGTGSIPPASAGGQTVSVDSSGTTGLKWGTCITVTAGNNTEVIASGRIQTDTANPSISTDSGTVGAARYCIVYSGTAGPASITNGSGLTSIHDQDFGANCARTVRRTSVETGNQAIAFTSALDDVAMIAVAISESTGQLPPPPLIASIPRY